MGLRRRPLLLAAVGLPWAAQAHHGWSSFDLQRPIYLEGVARQVRWQNPHAELVLELPSTLVVPADLKNRTLPAQTASVDTAWLLGKATVPQRKDRQWQVELAPLTRMQAWRVAEIKPGDRISLLGFTFKEEKGDAIVRVEYLFVGDQAYGLRSGPA